MSSTAFALRRLLAPTPAPIEQLTDGLIDCVDGGASVSFLHPLARQRAVEFWRKVADEAAAGDRVLIVADGARLHEKPGWIRVGEIPGYALDPRGGFCGTTFYYRDLSA